MKAIKIKSNALTEQTVIYRWKHCRGKRKSIAFCKQENSPLLQKAIPEIEKRKGSITIKK